MMAKKEKKEQTVVITVEFTFVLKDGHCIDLNDMKKLANIKALPELFKEVDDADKTEIKKIKVFER